MEHKRTLGYWQSMANSNPNEKTVKVNSQNDYTDIDASYILSHANRTSKILDLASGTGLSVNKYHQDVGSVDAVEKFPEFSKFIVNSENVNIYNADITEFEPRTEYDFVLMFGIVQYFNETEVRNLYAKYKGSLNNDGMLIVKNQFGVNEDVEVSGVSEELGTEYISQYRHIEKEESILRSIGFNALKVVDIYPPEANRWANTHFYAIEASSH